MFSTRRKQMRVKYTHPIKFYSFLIPCMLITFPPSLSWWMLVTLAWPWEWHYSMYRQEVVLRFGLGCTNLTYLLDKPSSEWPLPTTTMLSNEAPNPNTGQTPKSGHQFLLLEGDFAPETIHMDPSSSFSWNSPCTQPAPSPRPTATCLIQERFITGLSTQSHLYRKR